MFNYKEEIANKISKATDKVTNIDFNDLVNYIEIPPDSNMGDYAFPCFKLAKDFRKAPPAIAEDIKENIELDYDVIEKVEVQGGYLNFFINKKHLIKTVLEEFENKKDLYGSSKSGEGKNIVIDYSSPNIAKPFHIGHLRSTVIGSSLCKIYRYLGYNSIGVNHLGDYGTQFGKLIEAYKLWGDEYNIDNNPIEELTKMYVRINNLCKEDETVLNNCRNNFKKLEDGDEYCTKLWNKFRELSLKEFQKVYDLLDAKFDSWNGEAFYSDKMDEVKEMLEKSGKLVESEGAKIIDLEDKNMAPCIIEKTNGSTTYATRDLAAILYRVRTYDFAKALYVTSYEQVLHFKQVFEVAKLLNIDEKYTNNLIHVPFGMVQLSTGKMSTREGNIIKLEDLLNESIDRVRKIIETKNPNLENKEEVARKVGVGAIIFNDLANNRIKDEIFDWDEVLNFNGETGPYIQYMYVRTKSILEKTNKVPKLNEVKLDILNEPTEIDIIKQIYEYNNILEMVIDKNEPSILSRYLIDLSQKFSSLYNEKHIINEDLDKQNALVYLTYMIGSIIKSGAELLGMKMPEKM